MRCPKISEKIEKNWSAVILAGGLGSRLAPLTTNICKPMVNVTNKPMIDYAIDHLRFAGIKHIIICVKHMGVLLTDYLHRKWDPIMEKEEDLFIEIPKSDSKGTADAVRQVWDRIKTDYFIVSMADIITNLPVRKFMDFHIQKNADATISMKPIDEFATKYGNTILDDNGKILLFLEKPSAEEIFVSSLIDNQRQDVLPIINTGIYCFKKDCAHQAIMNTNYMDFGKDIFPFLLENQFRLYGFVEKYYWMDIGNPTTYLWAHWDMLREYGWPILPEGVETENKIWWKKEPIGPPSLKIDQRVCIGENIYFGENVKIGSLTSIGDNVKVGSGTVIEKSVIWDNVEIGENCTITDTVIANNCIIGNDVTIGTESILGPNVTIEEGVSLGSITIKAKGRISHK